MLASSPIAPPKPAAPPAVTPPPAAPTPPTPEPAAPAAAAPAKTEPAPLAKKPAAFGVDLETAIAKAKGEPAPAKVEEPKPAPAPEPPKAGDKAPDDSDDAIKAEIADKTKGMDGKSKQAWADLRFAERDARRQLKDMVPKTAVAEYETKVTELQKQLDEAKKAPAAVPVDNDKVAALEARLAEYEQDLTVAKVEKTEAFKNAVTTPLSAIQKKVEKLAAKASTTVEAMMKALTDTSDNRSDLLVEAASGLNKVDEADFYALAPKIDDINEKATTLRSQAKEALDKLASKSAGESAAQEQASRAAFTAAHETNWSKLQEVLPNVLTPLDATDAESLEWNKAQQDANDFALKTDYRALSPAEQSQVMQLASVHPLIVGTMQSLETQLSERNQQLEETRAELAKFQEKKPGGGTLLDPAPGDPGAGEVDIVKRLMRALPSAGR